MDFAVYFILPMLLGLRETREEYRNGGFSKLLSEPFDKMYMTRGQGQWPRVTGKNGSRKVAFLLKKSVGIRRLNYRFYWFTVSSSDSCCNKQLGTSFSKIKDSFIYPIPNFALYICNTKWNTASFFFCTVWSRVYEAVVHFWEAGFKPFVTTWVWTWHREYIVSVHFCFSGHSPVQRKRLKSKFKVRLG